MLIMCVLGHFQRDDNPKDINILLIWLFIIICEYTRWLIKTLKRKESKTKKSKEPESPSAATDLMQSNKSPTNSLVTPRLKMLKSQAQSDYLTNTCVSAAEELLAVRDQRPGTTGKWLCTRDTLTLNAQPPKSKKSLQSPFPAESRSASTSEPQLDDLLICISIHFYKSSQYVFAWLLNKPLLKVFHWNVLIVLIW